MLHLSRNAVWKAITDLRRDGYTILASTNKGYCLADNNDILSAEGILPFLCETAKSYGKTIHIYKSLESTNKTAKEMAIAGAAHGTTVISESQTAGRGRYAREFFSPGGGGLYMSIILRPEKLCFENTTSVTAFAAVAVCEAIEALSGKIPRIKWVNDIFLDGKKICGILTEAVTDFESGGLEWIVLGIGVNVTTPPEEFPEVLRETASSIYPDGGAPGARNRLSAEILNRILGFDTPPKEEDIFEKYKKRLLMLGEEITVVQGDTAYKATALDIDGAGRLLVKNENGEICTLHSGEIHIRK